MAAREYVKVTPGLAAQGLVEVRPVSGDLAAGDLVVVGHRDGVGGRRRHLSAERDEHHDQGLERDLGHIGHVWKLRKFGSVRILGQLGILRDVGDLGRHDEQGDLARGSRFEWGDRQSVPVARGTDDRARFRARHARTGRHRA